MSDARDVPAHLVRRKVEFDLADARISDEVRDDQIAYYRERAPWYDDVYTCTGDYDQGPEYNAQWRRDLAEIETALNAAPLHGNCVELGAGTGYWSERVIHRADRLWLLDGVAEVLAIAQHRLATQGDRVEFQTVDLWHWQPERTWDCAVACFFIEHVPNEVLPTLLGALHGALVPGAPFFIAEGAARESEPQVETRPIRGRTFRVVERRRTAEEFAEVFGAAGFSVDLTTSRFVIHGVATRE